MRTPTPHNTCRPTSTFVGLLLKGVALPHPNHGHVILGTPSPILVYPISSTEARVLVDIPPSEKLPSAATGALRTYLRERVTAQLPPSLQAAFEHSITHGKIRSMQVRRALSPGFALQLHCIPTACISRLPTPVENFLSVVG